MRVPAASILRGEIAAGSDYIQWYQLAQSLVPQIKAAPGGSPEKQAYDLGWRKKLAQTEVRANGAAEKTGHQYRTKESC